MPGLWVGQILNGLPVRMVAAEEGTEARTSLDRIIELFEVKARTLPLRKEFTG